MIRFHEVAEGMSKQEREAVGVEMKQLLYTLVNSVKKHLEDDDEEALKKRIESTTRGLITLAEDLKMKDYPKTAAFIRSNARFMVTFAKLALKNIRIPYTSNVIELNDAHQFHFLVGAETSPSIKHRCNRYVIYRKPNRQPRWFTPRVDF